MTDHTQQFASYTVYIKFENIDVWISSCLMKDLRILDDSKDVGCIFPEKTPLVFAHQ